MSRSNAVSERVPLLERERELRLLALVLDRAAEGSGAVVHLEGAAGIGKTSLLEAVRADAEERGITVLAARGGELEREFAHGIARGLFERRLADASSAEREELLAGSARLAAPAVGVPGSPPPAGEETGAVLHGLYWLTANLAGRGPLLLAVDDAHWADRASLRFLAYLAARVDGLPIALVTAARPREPGSDRPLLEQLAAASGGERLQPRPLSVDATAAVVSTRLGREAGAEFCAACHAATGGNPFLVRELAGALRADGADDDPARVRDLGPNTVSRSLLLRLSAMPAAAGAIAAAVAVLGNDVELHVAAAFAGVELGDAALAIDSLVDAEIFAPSLPLNFVHPIVRSAVYFDLGPGERAAAHARAADLLVASGASPDAVAPHLLHAAPAGDARLVALLREAAAAALRRGAPETAASYLRRAREETPAAREDGELLAELGSAEYLTGDGDEEAIGNLRRATELIADPGRRAEAWLALARTNLNTDVPAAVAVLEQAIEDLADLDPEELRRIEVERNCIGITHAGSFERAAARIDALPSPRGETAVERLVLANKAYRSATAGSDRAATIELCGRALGGGALIEEAGTESSAVSQVLHAMHIAELQEEAIAAASAAMRQASERGSAWGFTAASGVRASLHYFSGRLAAAEADARQALEPGCPPFGLPFISTFLALPLVERGELEEADAVIAAAGCGPDLQSIVHMDFLLWGRGRLRLVQGRAAEAAADLLEYGERCERVGARLSGAPWRADAALAFHATGDEERARELAGEQLRLAQRWGAPAALGQAHLVGGLIEGDLDSLQTAAALLADSPARLEAARALVELGAALRRAGRRVEARERLRDGLEAARACGATALVERAHEELITAGARPRRLMFSGLESLTASERRVAAMAAEGMGNREIAQRLFVTVKTVENHLGRTYAKLGIHSREELPAALGSEPPAPVDASG